jgi:TIR domain
MGRIEKTVFISYRRTDESWGQAIFLDLTHHGYDVFIDYDAIASGNFETAILENIRARAHFLVLLTPTALERCSEPNDWMCREIEAALDSKRNIVPLMFAGFDFYTPATASKLTGKLGALKEYNGLPIPKGYFSPAMERLRIKFLNVPVDAVLHPASDSAQQVAKEQKDKARAEAERRVEEEKRAAEEERRKREAEIEQRRKEEAEAKRRAEEEAQQRAADEERRKREAEIEQRRKEEAEAKRRAEEEAQQRAADEERLKREAEKQRAARVTWSDDLTAKFPNESPSRAYRYQVEKDGSILAVNAQQKLVTFPDEESLFNAEKNDWRTKQEKQKNTPPQAGSPITTAAPKKSLLILIFIICAVGIVGLLWSERDQRILRELSPGLKVVSGNDDCFSYQSKLGLGRKAAAIITDKKNPGGVQAARLYAKSGGLNIVFDQITDLETFKSYVPLITKAHPDSIIFCGRTDEGLVDFVRLAKTDSLI